MADTVRVRYLIGVEVGGRFHAPGTYEADVPPAEADALIGAGRAERVAVETHVEMAPEEHADHA